jgi:RNA ligase (TIGR02306 family)
MEKSTHQCLVVDVVLNKHPNADSLSYVNLFDGLARVVVNTAQWEGKTKAVFIPVQNYVDVRRPEFAYLSTKEGQEHFLVKGIKLRGMKSDGILIPVPNDTPTGEDWTQKLGIIHKVDEPEVESKETVSGPKGYNLSKYDIDSAKNFARYFIEGEEVVVTIKYHGQNARYLFKDGIQYFGGRTQWLEDKKSHPIVAAYYNNPSIKEFCEANPNLVLWGECINMQGKYNYGLPQGHRSFVAFDIRRLTGEWLSYDECWKLTSQHLIPMVRQVYRGPYSHDKIVELAESLPKEFGHEHEGVVVKPIKERDTPRFERLVYKIISSGFKG